MKHWLFAVATALVSAGAADAHELTRPPMLLHPLPQGMPYVVVGAVPHRVIQLRYGIVNGERVLFDPQTLQIVYILQP
jgi:hypothetical protein